MTIKPYIMVDYDLLKADGFVSKTTGAFVKLLANDKLLYSYVKARLRFFVDEKKGEYFDTQQAIADALSMNLSSAKNSLAKFRDHKVLFAKKEKFKNFENWRYKSLEELTLCYQGGKDGFKLITPTFVEEKRSSVPAKQTFQPAWMDEEQFEKIYADDIPEKVTNLYDNLWKKVEKKTVAQTKPKSYDKPKPTYVDDDEFDLPF